MTTLVKLQSGQFVRTNLPEEKVRDLLEMIRKYRVVAYIWVMDDNKCRMHIPASAIKSVCVKETKC